MNQWEQWTKTSMQAQDYLFRRVDENGHYMPHQAIYGFANYRVLQFYEAYALLSCLDKLHFKSFLDVGCAEGFYPRLVRARYGAEAYGVELSVSGVRRMWEYNRLEGVCGDAHALPIKTDAFDTVVCVNTIEHVTNPQQVISELMRVARNDLIIGVPIALHRKELEEFKPDFNTERDQHVHIFTRDTFQQFLPLDYPVTIYHAASLPVLLLNALYKNSLGRIGNFLPFVKVMILLDRLFSNCWSQHTIHIFAHISIAGKKIGSVGRRKSYSPLLKFLLEDIYRINQEELRAVPLYLGTDNSIPWGEFRVKLFETPPTRTRVSNRILSFLACPKCKSDVITDNNAITCSKCGAQYSSWDGIPVMHDIH